MARHRPGQLPDTSEADPSPNRSVIRPPPYLPLGFGGSDVVDTFDLQKGTLAISTSDPSPAQPFGGPRVDGPAPVGRRPSHQARLSSRYRPSDGPADRAPEAERTNSRRRALSFLGQAVSFGLATGILELAGEFVRKARLGESAWLSVNQLNPHYLWMVPASNVMLFGTIAVPLLVARFRPALTRRAASPVFCFLLVLSLLLVTRSIDRLASVSLAGGITTAIMSLRASRLARSRIVLRALVAAVLILTMGFVGVASWRDRNGRHHSPNAAPAAPANAPNVLMIVLDTVRADALSAYGAARDTSPHLARLARQGVRFEHARSAAPWTLASMASMLTGRWPYQLSRSDPRVPWTQPTRRSRNTSRVGVMRPGGSPANYIFCTGRYGLDRGFAHYIERGVSFEDLLGSSALGRQLCPLADALRFEWSRLVGKTPEPNAVDLRYYTRRRSASELNSAFLSWQSKQEGRPFFAFLNYFDAHAPYLTPPGQRKHFGLLPESRAEFEMLRNWDDDRMKGLWGKEASVPPTDRERALARDCYDDCIAYMDQQIARLLAELARRGLRKNTLVIITADHGEEFGENGLYGHFLSLHRAELDVPLLIIEPSKLPENHTVTEPVSLRNLPATVVDLLGLEAQSPFPGRSLARFWKPEKSCPRAACRTSQFLILEPSRTLSLRSLLSGTKVYIHHGDGIEQLFDRKDDPWETRDLVNSEQARPDLERLREMLSHLKPEDR